MTLRPAPQLRADAERIWWAGVRAVLPERLIPEHVTVDDDTLAFSDEVVDLRRVGRIAVVGAGKASGAMAVALERVLGPELLEQKQVGGWVNVPADCILPTQHIRLHPARPASVNEPRPEGVAGTKEILRLVSSLTSNDLCVCLLSGGGSALLPAPVAGVSLDVKIRLTQLMSAAGADIGQLNTVRRCLSVVKGGGLARACAAGRLITLILSDVPGDPLEAIASGPTVECEPDFDGAMDVLELLHLAENPQIEPATKYLRDGGREPQAEPASPRPAAVVTNLVIGNNATAVDAAGSEAERLGYSHAMIAATRGDGPAEEVGRHLAEMALRMRTDPGPDCLISGGEPTVTLVEESQRGLGGRNQQLALAALMALGGCDGIALLSAGTDGEDGPTDAAGAIVTSDVVRHAAELNLDPQDYLGRNDAYHLFEAAGGLFMTGSTQTNVCDLRVVVTNR